MIDIGTLLVLADAYKDAAGVEKDTTLSSRVFGDSKKLGALRDGADITVGRFNAAIEWFRSNWPDGIARHPLVADAPPEPKEAAE